MKTRARCRFFASCVQWTPADVHAAGGLCDMIASARQITRRTFCRNVERSARETLERELGYAPHDPAAVLTMARDYHVSYYVGTLHAERVYFLKWSAIEYVFKEAA